MSDDAKAATPAEQIKAQKERESLREKLIFTVLGFVLTGVIGTTLTTWVQQRGWSWQNRVAKIEKDTENAMAAYRATSEIINGRWHATYRLARALERNVAADEWKSAKDAFEQADKEWALRYTNIARELEFHIDTPFGIEPREDVARVWSLPCTDFALRTAQTRQARDETLIDATSARAVLAVINHCHGKIKDEIEQFIDKRDTASAEDRRTLAQATFPRLDHLYRSNEALRCIIFERALAIRRMATTESYWNTFFGIGTPNYQLAPSARNCVE